MGARFDLNRADYLRDLSDRVTAMSKTNTLVDASDVQRLREIATAVEESAIDFDDDLDDGEVFEHDAETFRED